MQRVAAGSAHSLVVANGSIVQNAPVITTQPLSRTVVAGTNATLTVAATGTPAVQWYHDGVPVTSGTSSSLLLNSSAPSDAGIYDAVLSAGSSSTLSAAAVVGIVPAAGQRTAGSVTTRAEWQNIHHSNGHTYDQYLLSGAAGTFTADPNQIARMSYVDTNGSIVQVEMSGAGAITVVLANATGPGAPALYNQSGIQYMRGKATIILAGADATTHFTIYSVGTATNPGVTRPDVTYNGWADVAVAGIVSSNGLLGGIHQGNASYNSGTGFTGIYAPTVIGMSSLAVVHEISARGSATPICISAPEARSASRSPAGAGPAQWRQRHRRRSLAGPDGRRPGLLWPCRCWAGHPDAAHRRRRRRCHRRPCHWPLIPG
ncbi:MAG: immunoglobulin domain-containing protein [Opitutaceae bacterium]|nr:immunoglobulin domain-containing protein [Opitutaceae bacterium]